VIERNKLNDADDALAELYGPSDEAKLGYLKVKIRKMVEIAKLVNQIFDGRSLLQKNTRLINDAGLIKALRNLPREIREYRNHADYLNHMKYKDGFIPAVRIRVKELFAKYHVYIDREKGEFAKSFPGNYYELMYELVAANFLSENGADFNLIDRELNSSGRDFCFLVGGQRYYFECTTINKTCLSEFVHAFYKMNSYLEIANIIKSRVTPSYADWTQNISKIFSTMASSLFDKILEEFKKIKQLNDGDAFIDTRDDANNVHLQEFIRWVGSAKDVIRLYRWVLPQEVIENLQAIDINKGSFSNSERDMSIDWFLGYLARATAKSILEKITKKNKKSDNPLVLFISIANIASEYSGHMMMGYQNFINYFHERLISYINEESVNYDSKQVADGLVNLYAVVIDTAHLNWFPDILPSNMPKGNNNCFAIFYNESISHEMSQKSTPLLFESMLPEQRQLKFVVDS